MPITVIGHSTSPRLDPNYGDEQSLQTMIDEAHKRGIRVLLDVVMNHAGYATLADLQDLGLKDLSPTRTSCLPAGPIGRLAGLYGNWHAATSISTTRAMHGRAGGVLTGYAPPCRAYQQPGSDDVTGAVGGLPDFITESTKAVDLPPFLKAKQDTNAKPPPNATVVDYLVKWHTDRAQVRHRRFPCRHGQTHRLGSSAELKTQAACRAEGVEGSSSREEGRRSAVLLQSEAWDHGVSKIRYQNGFNLIHQLDCFHGMRTGMGSPSVCVLQSQSMPSTPRTLTVIRTSTC